MDANDGYIWFASVSDKKLLLDEDTLNKRIVTDIAVRIFRAYLSEKRLETNIELDTALFI